MQPAGIRFAHEWVILTSLLGLLLGFAPLSKRLEEGRVSAARCPAAFLPAGSGASCCCALIFALSSFLDNVAAALIGGSMAVLVHRGKLHTGYPAAIVAASNREKTVFDDMPRSVSQYERGSAVVAMPNITEFDGC